MQRSSKYYIFFFFNDTATTEIYTLSLHDALPISAVPKRKRAPKLKTAAMQTAAKGLSTRVPTIVAIELAESWNPLMKRSEEHTSELQSRQYLVCRLLLEKKKQNNYIVRWHLFNLL